MLRATAEREKNTLPKIFRLCVTKEMVIDKWAKQLWKKRNRGGGGGREGEREAGRERERVGARGEPDNVQNESEKKQCERTE